MPTKAKTPDFFILIFFLLLCVFFKIMPHYAAFKCYFRMMHNTTKSETTKAVRGVLPRRRFGEMKNIYIQKTSDSHFPKPFVECTVNQCSSSGIISIKSFKHGD